MPPVDHDCSLRDIVVAMSNEIAKLKHELAQIKKAHIGPKTERSKMPRVPAKPPTPEEQQATRRARAADRAQTETVRTERKVPPEERTWHGQLAGVVPYDFRMPTMDRVRDRLWNPDGQLIGPHVFGVGWALNLGRAWRMIKEARSA